MKTFYQYIIILSIIGIQFSFSEINIEKSPKTLEDLGEKLFFDKISS